jgi:hypothetical protein
MYEDLHNLVDDLLPSLPDAISLRGIIVRIREATWTGLKDALSKYVDSYSQSPLGNTTLARHI